MPNAAVIDDATNTVINIIVVAGLEPNYGMHLCWPGPGCYIGGPYFGEDPETHIGIFIDPNPPVENPPDTES